MDDARTAFCGNLPEEMTEELLYELFLQVAPLERVKIPTDKDGRKSSFGFVTFKHEISVAYAVEMLNGTKLFERQMNVKPRKSNNQRNDSPLPIRKAMDTPYPYEERGQFAGHPNINPNQHVRFNDYADPGSPQSNYEEAKRLQQLEQRVSEQLMQSYQSFVNPYETSPYEVNPYYIDNPSRHWADRERDDLRGREDFHHRDRNDHRDREHHSHNRRHENDRRGDYSEQRRSDNHHSGGYGRSNRRRY